MSNLPNFKYLHNKESETLAVLLHGAGVGMNSQFMVKLMTAFEMEGDSVVSFNFPFFDRGDRNSSGSELKEEIGCLKNILSFCESGNYKRIRLVGKSLGGIIIGQYLKHIRGQDISKYEVIVFGYVTGSIDLSEFMGPITVIQGEKDKFGNISKVKSDMRSTISQECRYIEIPKADHSYRDAGSKEPLYEDIAIQAYFD